MAVRSRGKPEKPWVWEIHCAGKLKAVETSREFFDTMSEASRQGKAALQRWRTKQAA